MNGKCPRALTWAVARAVGDEAFAVARYEVGVTASSEAARAAATVQALWRCLFDLSPVTVAATSKVAGEAFAHGVDDAVQIAVMLRSEGVRYAVSLHLARVVLARVYIVGTLLDGAYTFGSRYGEAALCEDVAVPGWYRVMFDGLKARAVETGENGLRAYPVGAPFMPSVKRGRKGAGSRGAVLPDEYIQACSSEVVCVR